MQYDDCIKGYWFYGNSISKCPEPGDSYDAYLLSGVVTVPNQVYYNTAYDIDISSHSFTNTAQKTWCNDIGQSGGDYLCTTNNIKTLVFHNLPGPVWQPYNTLPSGAPGAVRIPSSAAYVGGRAYNAIGGVFSVVASSTGVSEDLGIIQEVDAGFSVSCQRWGTLPINRKNCWTYPKSYDGISIPLSALPARVDLYFSK